MSKNVRKIFVIVAIIFAVVCGACGNNGENAGKDGVKEVISGQEQSTLQNISAAGVEKLSWKDEHMAVGKSYQAVAVTENKIYGCSEENGRLVIVCQDKKSGNVEKQFSLPEDVLDVQSMDVDADGNIYLVAGKGEFENEFLKVDIAGNCCSMGSITLEDTENAFGIQAKGVYADSDGYFYVWYEMGVPLTEIFDDVEEKDYDTYGMIDRIYVKDADFDTVFYEQVPNCNGFQLLSFFVENGSNPGIVAKDSEGIYLQEMLVAEKKLSEPVRLEGSLELSSEDKVAAILENSFLYFRGSDLYEYDFAEQEAEKVLNFASLGVSTSDILYFAVGKDEMEIVDCFGEEKFVEYTTLVQGESEKTVLTLGVMSLNYATSLEKIITEYNRFSEDTRIEVVSYYDGQSGYDDALERLKLDVILGKAPDIVDVSGIDYSLFVNKGVFADLYDFFQKDADCTADMLMKSVLEAYESGGHLYTIAPAFQLYSMWGNADIIQNRSGVTLAELMQMLEASGKTINAISGFSADEPVLTTLCTFAMDEFIDWENSVCDFNGEYFKELLTFAKEYNPSGNGESMSQSIKNENIVLSVGLITSVADYQVQCALYGGTVDFVGYPTADGSGTALSYRGNELAINAGKEHQDDAWKFVKYYLLNGYGEGGFPVVISQFDEVMQEAMEPTMVNSIDGTYKASKGSYYDRDVNIDVFEATQVEVEAVKSLISKADHKFKYHVEIMNIITEEAQGYFAGQKTLEATTEIIQNRISLYLQEQGS